MDSFKQFLNSLPPVLDPREQEQLLIKYFETRDEDIREKLLVHNLRLCAQCASNFCKKYNMQNHQEDFFSVCYDQLAGSLDRFDPTKETSFATFTLNNMNLSLMRYVQQEDYFSSHLVETISLADNKDNEDSDMFNFLFDDTQLQEEVQTELLKEEIVKFIDSVNCLSHKKTMIKMYLGLGYPNRYTQSEIVSYFKCSRETVSTTVAKFLTLIQKYIAKNYKTVYPDYAQKVNKNKLVFKNTSERNQYILDAYYNEQSSKSVGELAKELGISKSCISDVIKRYQPTENGNSREHKIVYKRRKYLDQIESIFKDRYGVNSQLVLSKQELIMKYNLPSSVHEYSHMMKSIEDILIQE